MKKTALLPGIVLILILYCYPGSCKWVTVQPGSQHPDLQVESSDRGGLTVQLRLSGFESTPVRIFERDFERISFEGYGSFGDLGQPEIPVLRKLLRLPDREGWRFKIVAADFIDIEGYAVSPVQGEIVETPDGAVEPEPSIDESAYMQDRWYPSELVSLYQPVIMRGFRLGQIELHPVQFNPVRETLRVYRNLEVRIRFEGAGENCIDNTRSKKSKIFSRLVNSTIINPQTFVTDDDEVLGGYLFIAPPSFFNSTWLDELIEWKRQKGFPCTLLSTSTTGTSASAIKTYIQNNVYNAWDVPPDYLVLVGDSDQGMATHNYYPSPYNDATDLPYTLLEGDDYFPDMLVGRLSVDSDYPDLAMVCTKTIKYESNPYMGNTGWFSRGLMVYDYNGSLSCQNVKNRCRDLMLEHGYATVDTVTNPPYYSGGSLINAKINNGVTFVNYRGYGSYTSWTPPYYNVGDISSLTNGFMLPVITSIVCGGGNFASSSDPCFGEAWIRYGYSINNPKGAVAFMGPTCLYTSTRWNNCIDGGIYQGIFVEGIRDVASALLRGKIELYYGMPNNQGPGGPTNSVECYFHIYNILGDPGLEMWTGVPANLVVNHPDNLPLGVNYFNLSVESSGAAVEDALVCVYGSNTGYQITDWTDENGEVILDLAGASTGAYNVTVTGHNLHPYRGALTINQETVSLAVSDFTIDDDMSGESSGDGDGVVNPGETIELVVTLANTGSSTTATSVSGTVSTVDPYVNITQNYLNGPNAAPGNTSLLSDDFNLVFSQEAPHSHVIPIILDASCSQGSWTNLINLEVVAPLAEALEYEVQNPTGILEPGEIADLTVTIMNSGGDPLVNCAGTLSSLDDMVIVVDDYGYWGQINPGNSSENGSNLFTLQAAGNCPPGWMAPLELIVTSGNYIDTLTINFTVGRITDSDPTAPDAYGYRCFDSRDVGYEQIPVYDWLEVSTQPGQVTLNLPDNGNEQDTSVTRNLPFTFRYYGEDYNQITICSNGWLSMGNSVNYVSFRNWNIPGALGPPAMIAAFWDDLRLQSGASANYIYDAVNNRVAVEWKDWKTATGSGTNRFEIFLYDPAYVITPTGDGVIEFQYHTFNNADYSENYCTIGIENWDQSDGVKVTYANYYTLGSQTLSAGVALRFTTAIDYISTIPDMDVTLTYNSGSPVPVGGGYLNFDVTLQNNETVPVNFDLWIEIPPQVVPPTVPTRTLTFPGGYSIFRPDMDWPIPASWPAGNYQMVWNVGNLATTTIWAADSFPFSKSTVSNCSTYTFSQVDGDPLDQLFVGIDLGDLASVSEFALLGSYPNPFNPKTTIRFALPEAAEATLAIFDISGRCVSMPVNAFITAGIHEVTFDGSRLASGIYFVRFKAGDLTDMAKVVLLK